MLRLAAQRPVKVRIEERPPFWWLRYLPTLLVAIVFLYLAYFVGRVAIIPVLASFAIAYILNPIVEWFQQRQFSRSMSALLALVLVSVSIAGLLWFIVPDLWEQSASAIDVILKNMNQENASRVRAQLREWSPMLDNMVGWRLYRFVRSPDPLMEMSQSWAAGSLTGFLATAAGALDLLLIPFFVFYILVDFPGWRVSLEDLIPPRFRDPFSRLFDEVGRILQSYVLGQLMIAMVMAVLYAVGFFALSVPAWAGLAVLSGLLNIIPYVGTTLGVVLASGLEFAASGDVWKVAGVLIVFVVVQSIEGYYLTPKILGARLSLHPMAVFLGLLIGGRIFGFLGILLAVPTIAVSQVFLKFFREIYKTSDFYHAGESEEPPPEKTEEVIAKAAETVLAEQVEKQEGDEILAPVPADDDEAARRP
jgi:predicted PurR-regulated permease PerM